MIPFTQTISHRGPLCLPYNLFPLSVVLSRVIVSVLRLMLFILDYTCQVVRNTEVESSRLEFNAAAHDLSPLIPRCVDPANKVEVVHAFQSAEICALRDNN